MARFQIYHNLSIASMSCVLLLRYYHYNATDIRNTIQQKTTHSLKTNETDPDWECLVDSGWADQMALHLQLPLSHSIHFLSHDQMTPSFG